MAKSQLFRFFIQLLLTSIFVCKHGFAQDVRVKDLVSVRGNRTNNLVGYGLVIGLAQTGDTPDSFSTSRALSSVFSQMGMSPDANSRILTQSAAAVLVTAELPAFAKIGSRIDVKISILGNATSLAGGTLVLAPLKGPDGNIYALAEGNIVIGQVSGKGTGTLTSARIPNGATIEKSFNPELVFKGKVDLLLNRPDFTNSERISQVINEYFRETIAFSEDPSMVSVDLPEQFRDRVVSFLSEVENLSIRPDQKSVVIINEKTGTVVMGGDVKISEIVVSHNGLSIQIGKGKEAKKESVVPMSGSTVNELVKSLNQMGVKSGDLISILQSIHASGALRAELQIL